VYVLVEGFWIVSFVGALLLSAFMYRRGLHREYPIFSTFLVSEGLSGFVGFVLNRISYKAYYVEYWVSTLVIAGLGFAVIHEVFKHIFRPYESLRSFGAALFRWSALVLILISATMAISSAPLASTPRLSLILSLDRSVKLMQCGMVIFMYLFGRQLGLTERHRVFGISIGFGIYSGTDLIVITLISMFPNKAQVLSVPLLASWPIVLAIWSIYMYRKEPMRRRATVLDQPESWNYALSGIAHSDGGSAFLPNVVDTVERVLTKRNNGSSALN
jgi:hypothetical protein